MREEGNSSYANINKSMIQFTQSPLWDYYSTLASVICHLAIYVLISAVKSVIISVIISVPYQRDLLILFTLKVRGFIWSKDLMLV